MKGWIAIKKVEMYLCRQTVKQVEISPFPGQEICQVECQFEQPSVCTPHLRAFDLINIGSSLQEHF